jgi:5-methylcytosine-specific restriction enzyme A
MRVRGAKLQEMRRRLFRRQPLCVQCLEEGLETIATIRDHIIPLAEGGRDDETNEQALCQTHSDLKTQAEAQRGRARWR